MYTEQQNQKPLSTSELNDIVENIEKAWNENKSPYGGVAFCLPFLLSHPEMLTKLKALFKKSF